MENSLVNSIPFKNGNEVEKYNIYYSESKFWKKLRMISRKAGAVVLTPMLYLYYILKEGEVSLKHKAYILGALGYFIFPLDLIPDFVFPVIGFTDDIAVAMLVLRLVKENLTPSVVAKAETKVMELMKQTC